MTADEIKDQIIQKQDELITLTNQASIRGWTYIMWKHRKEFYKEIAELRQQLEKSKETKLSLPLDIPTDEEIEINLPAKTMLDNDDYSYGERSGFLSGAKWAIEQIIERNQK